MKKIFTIFSATLILTSFTLLTGLNDVVNGIKTGNAAAISTYFDNSIDITIAGKEGSYSKSQGETILRDFFANNTVKSFTILHQGESGAAQFCIGTLITKNGTYRTTINLLKKGDKQLLQEIKFDN
ncbi:MAG: DUF4783 domain-containing protein [Ferruginibacter sp.]|nr:DUF4783 domain-containing protein [Ferruginibacter sp.]